MQEDFIQTIHLVKGLTPVSLSRSEIHELGTINMYKGTGLSSVISASHNDVYFRIFWRTKWSRTSIRWRRIFTGMSWESFQRTIYDHGRSAKKKDSVVYLVGYSDPDWTVPISIDLSMVYTDGIPVRPPRREPWWRRRNRRRFIMNEFDAGDDDNVREFDFVLRPRDHRDDSDSDDDNDGDDGDEVNADVNDNVNDNVDGGGENAGDIVNDDQFNFEELQE